MEKLFLGFFRISDELDVVHDEDIVLAVLVFEIISRALAHRVDIVDRESLARDIQDFFVRVLFLEVVADRLNEVSLSVACLPVDKERLYARPGRSSTALAAV
jgi:hypothetical protein